LYSSIECNKRKTGKLKKKENNFSANSGLYFFSLLLAEATFNSQPTPETLDTGDRAGEEKPYTSKEGEKEGRREGV